MISFNDPIRQEGIRKMIRNEISKRLWGLEFTVKIATESLRELAKIGANANIDFKKLCETMDYYLLLIKIERRIRLFNFINRGIIKLWIGG